MGKLYVIGAGPGDPGGLTVRGLEICRAVPELFAFGRCRDGLAAEVARPVRPFGPKLDPAMDELAATLRAVDAGLLLSGDPCLYSLLPRLKVRFGDDLVEVIPAPGALQALFAKLGESWEGAAIVSGHGRPLGGGQLAAMVAHRSLTVLFCDDEHSPGWACEALVAAGLGGLPVAAGERLGQSGERLAVGTAERLVGLDFGGLSVVRFRNPSPLGRFWPGLADERFRRGAVPMTKRFVRSQIVTLLAPDEDDCLWDVGAGTGSVSVELALAAPLGPVWAVERGDEGLELIKSNGQALGAFNLHAVAGVAPEALGGLPTPKRVFVGGSGGRLVGILGEVRHRGAGIVVVVSSATVETSAEAAALLEGPGFVEATAVTLAVTEHVRTGRVHLNRAQNPVTLWRAVTTGE